MNLRWGRDRKLRACVDTHGHVVGNLGNFRHTFKQNCRWWQWLALCGSRGTGNGGDQVLWGQEWGQGPGAQTCSPGFVRDARVDVSGRGDRPPALALPPRSTFPTLEPFSQAGVCCSANKDSRLPSWHPLVHHGALLESSSLPGGVPALHHPLPHTPAAQVPFGLGPSFPILLY